MKNLKFLLPVLCILLAAFSFVDAQPIFTIHQDFSYTTSSNCGPGIPIVSATNPISPAQVTVDVSHDIHSPTSPNLPSNLNDQCYRFIYFDIYDVKNGIETLEISVLKLSHWLHGALSFYGSSTTTFDLTYQNLRNNDLSNGIKRVYPRVVYKYVGDSPYILNMFATSNNSPMCSMMDISQSNTPLTCNGSAITCFKYEDCDADLSVDGRLEQILISDGGPNYWANKYIYGVGVSGGSGNYSYYWTVQNLPNTSTTNKLVFITLQTPGVISVRVTDNVTGCIYYWYSSGKKPLASAAAVYSMEIGPNPIESGADLTINYLLPAADKVDFEIYDLMGKRLRHLGQADGHLGENTFQLRGAALVPGIYLIQVRSTTAGTLTKRLVVQ